MTSSRSTATHSSWAEPATVIGIDPGLACTGIGIIRRDGSRCACVEHQVVRSPASAPLAERLAGIHAAVAAMCAKHRPDRGAVERTFVNMNEASSLALGQARGAALAALGTAGIDIHELAPATVKKQIAGDRNASKERVARMVKSMLDLPLAMRLAADASDALAIALSAGPHPATATRRMRRGRRRR